MACFDRRYLRELGPAFALAAIAMGILFLFPRSPGRRLVALGVSTALLVWVLLVTVAALRRLDELEQRLHLLAIAASFTATGVLLAVLPLAQALGLAWQPPSLFWWMFMLLFWAASLAVLNRRYR